MDVVRKEKWRGPRALCSLGAAALLAGCSVMPRPLTLQENSTQAQQDLAAITARLEPVKGPMTLPDATARAIRNNLELRVRQMEQMVQSGQLDVSRYDMLPRLALSAGYSWRNNDAFGVGYQPDGTISTTPSAASERIRSTANAALSWNVLDFGLSYFRARQNADNVLIAEERRRRALQNLVQDVRLAWWRAEAAQRLLPQMDKMIEQIDQAAERSRLIESRRLMSPLQIIAYRRSLLDLQQQLSQRRQELAQWRSEFSELVGIAPGERYRIAGPASTAALVAPELTTRAEDLAAMALERRPELAEERLRVRITADEGKRQLLSLMPNLSLAFGPNYDSNRFLVNNEWVDATGGVALNLLKLLSLPAMQRAQKANVELDRARREALTMAVMAQTHVAVSRYELLRHEMGIWNQALADDRALLQSMQAAQQSGFETELELMRAAARVAITEINRDIIHANLEHAMGRVMNSVGYDIVDAQTNVDDGPTLAKQLDGALAQFGQQHFRLVANTPVSPVGIGEIVGVPNESLADFRQSMVNVMNVSRFTLDQRSPAVKVDVAVKMAPQQPSGRPVNVKVTLSDGPSGNLLQVVQMNSMLVEPVTQDQWKVLGEAAVFKVADVLRRLVGGTPRARDTLSLTEGGALRLDRTWSGPAPAPATP
ncbi:TolC family protein [Ramlibacter albus]|uniref:TolC family protein n=1 Tax=Ramlibacter albus TaxID=2079448 RepID=A0A923M3J9_9BURK|nr:TolC family protein [Ramlibacter albus]MBC5763290.1 TolC family protein [Ramlibacter albus]